MSLPMKRNQRETQRPIQVWVERDQIDALMKADVNVSEIVRDAIKRAFDELASSTAAAPGSRSMPSGSR